VAHIAESTEHRVQSTEYRAQSTLTQSIVSKLCGGAFCGGQSMGACKCPPGHFRRLKCRRTELAARTETLEARLKCGWCVVDTVFGTDCLLQTVCSADCVRVFFSGAPVSACRAGRSAREIDTLCG